MKISKQQVTLLDYMGSDLAVVNAARVSFAKESKWENTKTDLFSGEGSLHDDGKLSSRDQHLIEYLAKHSHWSPFSHCFLSFRIKAPIFVARQLGKHQVGLSWNEVSRRYVSEEPSFYLPDGWRHTAENVKQGSSEDIVDWKKLPPAVYGSFYERSLELYNQMLDIGVCPEQARMLLPQSMMTTWIWSGSLYAFARVCNLRLDSHAQKECQEVAQMLSDNIEPLFPVSWNVLVNK